MAERKLIELLIDEETENFGVEAISLVKYPAIESNFVYFSKQDQKRAMYSMTSIDEDKRTLIGPALIPDKIIPRYDEFSDEEYDVYFSKQTVQQASELFLKKNYTNNHTFEHQDAVDGVHVVESWIVSNPEMDKSTHYGLSVPEGTWMVRVHVANDDMWKFVKEQKVAGFSIEGYFLDKVENMSDMKREPSWFKKLESMITGRKFYAEIVTDNGQTFATEDEAFAPGVKTFKIGAEGTELEVQNGQYKTQAGTTFEVFDSVVTEWNGEVLATEQKPVEEAKEQLMKKYEAKLSEMKKKKTAMSYNGWANWETWTINVHGLITEMAEYAKDLDVSELSQIDKDWCHDYCYDIIFDGSYNAIVEQILNGFMADVDWYEVADTVKEDAQNYY